MLNFWFLSGGILLVAGLAALIVRRQRQHIRNERILNYFATSLYGSNTVEDVFWDIAQNCIGQLGFEDCVIYYYDEPSQNLIQIAAYGPKNPSKREIYHPIVIPFGQGITGYVAQTGKALIVKDTAREPRYILDDERRLSEITVPIIIDGKVFGVIDSEHSRRNFFNRKHLYMLQQIAAICSNKLVRHLTEEKLRQKIARDLHDEMGSALTSINITSTIALQEQDPGKMLAYLQRIKENSGKVMESINDIVWSIDPANDTVEKIVIRLRAFASELFEAAAIEYSVEARPDVNDYKLGLSQRKELYLIAKEALTNIAKHSRASRALLEFSVKDGKLAVRIADNGIGVSGGGAGKAGGNGLMNMKIRAGRADICLAIESCGDGGTQIHLDLQSSIT